jgi:hypothetical protein
MNPACRIEHPDSSPQGLGMGKGSFDAGHVRKSTSLIAPTMDSRLTSPQSA